MQRHGLQTSARHRAMGDVEVVLAWLAVAAQELGAAQISSQAATLLQGSAALPPHLETALSDVPESPGVYLFYGESALPLYIGKSVKMRSRVLSHFQAAGRAAREMRIAQEIRRIEWIETAGELGALLLEARLVKERQPVYNRQLRRERTLCAWRLDTNPLARPLLSLVRGEDLAPQEFGQLYGVYRSKTQAIAGLRELADKHSLCPQALGLESGRGRCFAHQIGRCKGVCCAAERPELHYLRLQLALAQQQLRVWPHAGKIGLREHHDASGRTEIHVFDQWCHLATVHDNSELEDALNARRTLAFDLDTYRLLIKHFARPGNSRHEIIEFTAHA
jgi:DNA polymerase-3 subunit epsilon